MLRIYEVALRVIAELRPVLVTIERKDRDLARQMRRAASSVVLNTQARGPGSRCEQRVTGVGAPVDFVTPAGETRGKTRGARFLREVS
jgi:hypothetical protein